jgi:hypothetical protein
MSIFYPPEDGGEVRVRRVVAYVAGFIVLCVATSWLVWGFGVASSGVKGRGDVIRQNNDATNRIAAQNEFNQLWSDIKTYHANIKDDAQAVAANPGDAWTLSVLDAEKKTCRSAAGKYNADTQNMTMKDWRPSTDPASIDVATECEATP